MESRLGYLSYVDNQSANAVLLRWGIPPPAITAIWFAIALSVSAAAIFQARVLRRHGQEVYGILVIGCAALVASPISWGHHMFWEVLASMLFGPDLGPRARCAVGLVGALRVNYRFITSVLLACGGLWWAAGRGGPR